MREYDLDGINESYIQWLLRKSDQTLTETDEVPTYNTNMVDTACNTNCMIRKIYIASSSSSSPDTSAFSWPALAMSCARSCSSVSETALG